MGYIDFLKLNLSLKLIYNLTCHVSAAAYNARHSMPSSELVVEGGSAKKIGWPE
ncbi:hypothetical protein HBA55_33025 [Pseudomaricurvus alkylphenolicus]|uniref:hypothetical protein n=1 Tax=Pseudomaricurvus alkylphenolicus TaxID=1306991 RepID=UPI00141DCE0B|nr:hypothetical protein [Pseudomaricurvus alkylphenolicus]NIB44457.1 hypothetical protein [Pseudomaricurvus alkylphenolicus]